MWDDIRAQQLAENIKQDLKLLKDFEDKKRVEENPRKIAQYDNEIERQRESLGVVPTLVSHTELYYII